MWLETFLWVQSNSKKVSYLPWQNQYPRLQTTCQIKPNFLWNKLLENLQLEKYLIYLSLRLFGTYLVPAWLTKFCAKMRLTISKFFPQSELIEIVFKENTIYKQPIWYFLQNMTNCTLAIFSVFWWLFIEFKKWKIFWLISGTENDFFISNWK